VPSLKVLVRWYYEEACSSFFLLIGVVLRRGSNDQGLLSLACGDRDVCEKGCELIWPIMPLGQGNGGLEEIA
jgi:hypothetical protein